MSVSPTPPGTTLQPTETKERGEDFDEQIESLNHEIDKIDIDNSLKQDNHKLTGNAASKDRGHLQDSAGTLLGGGIG